MFCVSRSIVVFVSSRKRHTRCALVTGVQTGALPISAQWIRDADLGDYYQLRSAPAGQVGVEPMDFSAWDRDDLLHEHVHAVEGGRRSEERREGQECVRTCRYRWAPRHDKQRTHRVDTHATSRRLYLTMKITV